MAAATRHKFAVNALVLADDTRFPGVVWKVRTQPAGARGVNYTLDNISTPGARGLKAPEHVLTAFDGTEEDARDPEKIAARQRAAYVQAFVPAPEVGAVVTVDNPRIDARLLFVVMADKGDGVKLVRLGGDGGRYYPNIPTKYVTEVPAADIATKMPGHIAAVALAR
jgi:hypothetical protein